MTRGASWVMTRGVRLSVVPRLSPSSLSRPVRFPPFSDVIVFSTPCVCEDPYLLFPPPPRKLPANPPCLSPAVVQVLLHTFDRANRERAAKEGLSAITLTAFVEARRPELVDLLATPSEETGWVSISQSSSKSTAHHRNTYSQKLSTSSPRPARRPGQYLPWPISEPISQLAGQVATPLPSGILRPTNGDDVASSCSFVGSGCMRVLVAGRGRRTAQPSTGPCTSDGWQHMGLHVHDSMCRLLSPSHLLYFPSCLPSACRLSFCLTTFPMGAFLVPCSLPDAVPFPCSLSRPSFRLVVVVQVGADGGHPCRPSLPGRHPRREARLEEVLLHG